MLLDYHIHLALKQAKTLYIDNAGRFAGLFQGIAPAVVESWRAQLLATPPTVLLLGSQGPSNVHHLWVVSQQGAQPAEEFLGHHLTETLGGAIEVQRVDVYCAARDPEMAMCMHVLARACIIAHEKAFLKGPYNSVEYEGFAGTTMEAEAIAERLGLAVRIQNWSASVTWMVPEKDTPALHTWDVRAADAGGGVIV
jgi:hypothetical protein